MPDGAGPTQLVARRYQEEILSSAQRGNVIAALDTGTGKTFIAVKLIQQITSLPAAGRKVVIYLAPTVPLVKQQATFIHSQLGHCLKTKSYIGEMVDLWDEEKWLTEFGAQDILVMTPQILVDILSHARWSLTKVSLLVFDEAHHARKNHPYAQVLRNHVAKLPHAERPKVFGMTASPTLDHKNPQKSIRDLEAMMNATVIAVKEHQAELSSFAHKPVEQVFLYATTPLACPDAQAGALCAFPAVTATELPEFSALAGRRDFLLASLGPFAAEFFTHQYLTSLLSKNPSTSKGYALLQAHLASVTSRLSTLRLDDGLISPKLRLLADVLCENHTEHFKCVIFVEQKHVATTLAALLPKLPELDWVSSAALIGHAGSGAADIGGFNEKQQTEVVKNFRSNIHNVLVATSVAEEGLDFQACHLVVRFDGLQNLKAYVQSRGRARRQHSTYVVLLPADDSAALAKYESMRKSEPLLREQYATASLPDASETMDIDEPSELDLGLRERYVVASTGASLTYDGAITALERLCASAPSDEYGVLRPTYTVRALGEQSFAAVVDLPPALPLPRTALRFESGPPRASKREARRAAAFAAVTALHALGVFDDHLLPVNHKRDKRGEDAYGRRAEDVSDVPEIMRVEVIQPWVAVDAEIWVHEYRVNGTLAAGFVTGAPMPPVEFTVNGSSYAISSGYPLPTDLQMNALLLEYTKTLLRLCGVLTKDYPGPFAFLLALVRLETRGIDLEGMQSFVLNPTTSDWAASRVSSDPTLVVNRVRLGHLHVLEQRTNLTAQDRPVSVDGPNREQGFASYCDYYEDMFANKKYTADVPPASSILLLQELPRLGTSSYDIESTTGLDRMAEFASPGRMQRMVPESLCLRLHLSFPCAEAVRHIPQLTRRLTDVVRAQALGFTGIPTNALIEATTLPHAYVGFDNQRLETLGDAFLKLGVSVYAFNAFPFKHEGQLTNVRIPSVSNRCLLARARAFGLHRFLSGEVGSQKKWSPCLGDGRVDMPRRSMQECVEALLGAAFATGGVPSALAVGERLGLCFGPADQSWTARYGHPSPGPRRLLLRQLQLDLGYQFTNETLLLEAITHRTMQFSETPSYERLEFLGDALIDMVVIHDVFTRYPKATCGQLSWARQRAVCNPTLAWIAVNKLRLHECLLQNNIELAMAIDAAKVQLLSLPIEEVVRDGWKMDMPKPLGDLVESVVAAVFIDMANDYERAAEQIRVIFKDVLQLLSPNMARDPGTELMLSIGKYGCGKVKFRKCASNPEGGRNDSYTIVVHDIEVIRPITYSSLPLAKAFAAEAARKVLEDDESPFHMMHLCTCMKTTRQRSQPDDMDGPDEEQTTDETEEGFEQKVQYALEAEGQIVSVDEGEHSDDAIPGTVTPALV